MNRRQFLGGGLLGLASSGVKALSNPAPGSAGRPLLNRWVKVQAWLDDTHHQRQRFRGSGYIGIWVDYDQLTGNFEIGSPYDQIYRWPMANLWLDRNAQIPEDWRDGQGPFSMPLPPKSLQWSEWMGNIRIVESTGYKYQFPRYVKVAICRDIAEGIDDKRPLDRRDDCSALWLDFDLMTGESFRCPENDPIFDSELARDNVFE